MVDAGKSQKVKVITGKQFAQQFFSHDKYEIVRKLRPFGSAVDPDSGVADEIPYISVKYAIQNSQKWLTVTDICELLTQGRKLILIGDYGSGKSRCVRECFYEFSKKQSDFHRYPISIDLRDNWGLKRYSEIIRRHFDDLGHSALSEEVLRVLPVGSFIFLLDGFDELGSQAWSVDTDRLRQIRAQSLEGVKDLIAHHPGGLLITGRAHYFNSDAEMLSALGLTDENSDLLLCKEEFDPDELRAYFEVLQINVDFPVWLPRKPLICKTISALDADAIEKMFEEEGGDVDFWHHFFNVICKRDVRIHSSLDPVTLNGLLKSLARLTRAKTADVGPLTLTEIQGVFENLVGQTPVEQASQMLQRLPSLGRLKAESNDRQFVDSYILDGLRAIDLLDGISLFDISLADASWKNPLDKLGQRILAAGLGSLEKQALQMALRCCSGQNRILASDVVASSCQSDKKSYDFKGFGLDEGHFLFFDMSRVHLSILRMTNSTFARFVFPNSQPTHVSIENSVIDTAFGLTSPKGMPSWFINSDISNFESAENVSRIRQIGLAPSHEILVTVIRKIFFQKGGGRKEEALVRGLGSIGRSGLTDKILRLLITHGVLERFKGNEGWVYTAERKHTARMGKMLAGLSLSQDNIWREASSFD